MGEVMNKETKVEKVTADKNKKGEVLTQKTQVEEVGAKAGGAKCSKYFAFVRNILQKKREKRARLREEQNGITLLRGDEVNKYEEEHNVIVAQFEPSQSTATPILLESPEASVLPSL